MRDRTFLPALALGLGGAALGAIGAGQEWATASATAPGPREVAASGSEVAPIALPLALVALACWGAVLVLRTVGRRVVSALGAAASVGGVVAVLATVRDAGTVAGELVTDAETVTMSTTAWPWVAAVGLSASAVTFAVALVRCPGWPQMSRRYDRTPATAPGAREAQEATTDEPRDLWRALDDGHDPTL